MSGTGSFTIYWDAGNTTPADSLDHALKIVESEGFAFRGKIGPDGIDIMCAETGVIKATICDAHGVRARERNVIRWPASTDICSATGVAVYRPVEARAWVYRDANNVLSITKWRPWKVVWVFTVEAFG